METELFLAGLKPVPRWQRRGPRKEERSNEIKPRLCMAAVST